MGQQFLDLLASSTIVQGLVTLMVLGAWLYMIVQQIPTPAILDTAVGLVLGFYFGAKIQNLMHSNQQTIAEAKKKIEADC